MVTRGLVRSRARAADLVARGAVTVDGATARKAGLLVDEKTRIAIDAAANAYVARSGAKLAAALDHFGLSATGRVALDIGASTGGFTEVLLERGALLVHAVEIGHGQLDTGIARDHRVRSHEGTDARTLTRELIAEPVAAIVADVSFISLTQALPAALSLATPDAWLVALVKPQFEAGRAAIGKRGVVKDEAVRRAAVDHVADWLARQGWRIIGDMTSPLPGKEGNIEHLIGGVRE